MKWCDGKAKRSATWDTSSSRTRIHRSWRMTRLPSRAGRCPGSRGDALHPHDSVGTFLLLRSTPLPYSSSNAPPHHLTIRQHEPLLLTQTYGGGHPPAPKMESGGDDCARSLHRRYPRIECTAAPEPIAAQAFTDIHAAFFDHPSAATRAMRRLMSPVSRGLYCNAGHRGMHVRLPSNSAVESVQPIMLTDTSPPSVETLAQPPGVGTMHPRGMRTRR